MATNPDALLEHLETILTSTEPRAVKAEQVATAIRRSRAYRWVGLYDVTATEIAIIAWSGPGPPAYPCFPVTQGLSGEAVATRRTIVSNDVAQDPRYLTAFGSTQAEIIIPVLHPASQGVIGTIDVESEQKGAFTEADQAFLATCARVVGRLWVRAGAATE